MKSISLAVVDSQVKLFVVSICLETFAFLSFSRNRSVVMPEYFIEKQFWFL